jgi:predicted PurR-regulated permease PerM
MRTRDVGARTVFAWVLLTTLAVVSWLLVKPLLSWLLATGFLAVALVPAQRRLERRLDPRFSAGLLVTAVVLTVVVPLAFGVNVLVARGTGLLDSIFSAGEFQQIHRAVEQSTGYSVPVEPLVRRAVERVTTYARAQAEMVIRASLDALVGFLLLTYLLYSLLVDRRSFVAWLRRTVPLAPDVRDELFESTNEMVWAVLKGHVAVAVVQGLVAGIGLFVTGVPNPLGLTIAMMFLAIVPVIGVSPVLGGAVLYLALNGQMLSAAFVVVWGFTAVAVTDDYLRAWLIGEETNIHGALVFVGVAGGTYLLGVMGLFVGPILVGLLKVTVDVFGSHYGVGHGPAAD